MAGSDLVRVEMRGHVRVLWLCAPPGNLFGPALCSALLAALHTGLADPGTQAIVLASGLRGPGQGFSGGVDLADLARDWPPHQARPADIARLILTASLPVIAALHGPTLGAGAEIALAAQGRVAAPDLRFGLRDLLVGRLPMAGATQTLPRLIGAAEALRLIGKGAGVMAAEAVALGLVDAVTEGDLLAAACAMAEHPPGAGRSPGLRDGRGYQAGLLQARAAAAPQDAALSALIDCVEAAQLLPAPQGLAFEAAAADDIATRPQARALQHLMAAEMRMVADFAGGQPVQRIGLWGAASWPLIGPALRAGITVMLADDDQAALLKAVEKVALGQQEQVASGQLTAAARDQDWARLQPVATVSDLASCGLVIAAKPGTMGRVLHWNGGGSEAAPDAARLILVAPGFAELQLPPADRAFGQMAAATLRQLRLRLAITHAPPSSGVARALVMAALAACKALHALGVGRDDIGAALHGTLRLPLTATLQNLPGPLTASPQLSADDICWRVIAATVAEGARLLMQGSVPRAGTLDALAVTALGMPRSLGGPLCMADQRGLLVVRRDLTRWQQDHAVWTPPALLHELVAQGRPLRGVDMDNPA